MRSVLPILLVLFSVIESVAETPFTQMVLHNQRSQELRISVLQLSPEVEQTVLPQIQTRSANEVITVVHGPNESRDFGKAKKVQVESASSISRETIGRTSLLVAITCTGVFSSIFFITSEIPQAIATSVLAGIIQTVLLNYYGLFEAYQTKGIDLVNKLSKKLQLSLPKQLIKEIGRTSSLYLYNVITSAAFYGISNWGNITPSFETLVEVLSIAAIGVFSNNTWDFLISGMNNKTDLEYASKKTVNMGRQLILALISPLVFYPPTAVVGKLLMGGVGLAGLVAYFDKDKSKVLAQGLTERLLKHSSTQLALKGIDKLFEMGSMFSIKNKCVRIIKSAN